MAFKVDFVDAGKSVTFENKPTPADIAEVEQRLGIGKKTQPTKKKGDFLGTASKVLDTVFGGGKLGEAIGSKLAPLTVPKDVRQFVDTKGPSAKEVAGSIGRSALLFTPVGRAAGALGAGAKALGAGSKFATGVGRVGAGAGTGFGFDVASGLEQDKTIKESLKPGVGTFVGGGLPVAGAAIRGTGRFAGGFAKNIAAGLSGKGTKVIDAILENPKAALEGLRGQATLPGAATQIREGVADIAKKAGQEFADDLAKLPKAISTSKGRSVVVLNGKNITLTTKGIQEKITQMLQQFNVKVSRKGVLDASEAALDNAEAKRLQEVFDVIKTWKDTTPVGIHNLAKKISNFRKSGEQSKQLNAIIDTVSRNARDYIGDRIPAAKQMLTKFAEAQDILNALNQEFATKGRTLGGLAERIKTERKISNLFSGEKESTLGLLRERLPGGANIISQEAGRELGGITRASASLGDLLRSAIQTVISPQLIGKLTAATGLTAQQVSRLTTHLKNMDPALRPVLIEVLSDIFRSDD